MAKDQEWEPGALTRFCPGCGRNMGKNAFVNKDGTLNEKCRACQPQKQ